jgi:hypothetical protein
MSSKLISLASLFEGARSLLLEADPKLSRMVPVHRWHQNHIWVWLKGPSGVPMLTKTTHLGIQKRKTKVIAPGEPLFMVGKIDPYTYKSPNDIYPMDWAGPGSAEFSEPPNPETDSKYVAFTGKGMPDEDQPEAPAASIEGFTPDTDIPDEQGWVDGDFGDDAAMLSPDKSHIVSMDSGKVLWPPSLEHPSSAPEIPAGVEPAGKLDQHGLVMYVASDPMDLELSLLPDGRLGSLEGSTTYTVYKRDYDGEMVPTTTSVKAADVAKSKQPAPVKKAPEPVAVQPAKTSTGTHTEPESEPVVKEADPTEDPNGYSYLPNTYDSVKGEGVSILPRAMFGIWRPHANGYQRTTAAGAPMILFTMVRLEAVKALESGKLHGQPMLHIDTNGALVIKTNVSAPGLKLVLLPNGLVAVSVGGGYDTIANAYVDSWPDETILHEYTVDQVRSMVLDPAADYQYKPHTEAPATPKKPEELVLFDADAMGLQRVQMADDTEFYKLPNGEYATPYFNAPDQEWQYDVMEYEGGPADKLTSWKDTGGAYTVDEIKNGALPALKAFVTPGQLSLVPALLHALPALLRVEEVPYLYKVPNGPFIRVPLNAAPGFLGMEWNGKGDASNEDFWEPTGKKYSQEEVQNWGETFTAPSPFAPPVKWTEVTAFKDLKMKDAYGFHMFKHLPTQTEFSVVNNEWARYSQADGTYRFFKPSSSPLKGAVAASDYTKMELDLSKSFLTPEEALALGEPVTPDETALKVFTTMWGELPLGFWTTSSEMKASQNEITDLKLDPSADSYGVAVWVFTKDPKWADYNQEIYQLPNGELARYTNHTFFVLNLNSASLFQPDGITQAAVQDMKPKGQGFEHQQASKVKITTTMWGKVPEGFWTTAAHLATTEKAIQTIQADPNATSYGVAVRLIGGGASPISWWQLPNGDLARWDDADGSFLSDGVSLTTQAVQNMKPKTPFGTAHAPAPASKVLTPKDPNGYTLVTIGASELSELPRGLHGFWLSTLKAYSLYDIGDDGVAVARDGVVIKPEGIAVLKRTVPLFGTYFGVDFDEHGALVLAKGKKGKPGTIRLAPNGQLVKFLSSKFKFAKYADDKVTILKDAGAYYLKQVVRKMALTATSNPYVYTGPGAISYTPPAADPAGTLLPNDPAGTPPNGLPPGHKSLGKMDAHGVLQLQMTIGAQSKAYLLPGGKLVVDYDEEEGGYDAYWTYTAATGWTADFAILSQIPTIKTSGIGQAIESPIPDPDELNGIGATDDILDPDLPSGSKPVKMLWTSAKDVVKHFTSDTATTELQKSVVEEYPFLQVLKYKKKAGKIYANSWFVIPLSHKHHVILLRMGKDLKKARVYTLNGEGIPRMLSRSDLVSAANVRWTMDQILSGVIAKRVGTYDGTGNFAHWESFEWTHIAKIPNVPKQSTRGEKPNYKDKPYAVPEPEPEPTAYEIELPVAPTAPDAVAAKGVPKLSTLTKVGSGKSLGLGGAGAKDVLKDSSGQKYLWKPAWPKGSQAPEHFRGYAQSLFSNLATQVRPDHIPIGIDTNKDGVLGTVQPMIELDGESLGHVPPSDLTEQQRLDVATEHMLDWATSQHDTHPGNLVKTKDGRILSVDKEQGYKHLGSDELSVDYHPNKKFGEDEPYYNTFWRDWANGKFEFDPQKMAAGFHTLQTTDLKDYEQQLRAYAVSSPYIENGYAIEEFVQKAISRRNTAKRDFEKFLTKLYQKRSGNEGNFTFADGWIEKGKSPKMKIVHMDSKQWAERLGVKVREHEFKDEEGNVTKDPTLITLKMAVAKGDTGWDAEQAKVALDKLQKYFDDNGLEVKGGPLTGTVNVLLFADKAAFENLPPVAEEVPINESTVVPHAGTAEYLPTVEALSAVAPNYEELDTIHDQKNLNVTGRRVLLDSDLIEGQSASVRRFKSSTGKVYYTVVFKTRPALQFKSSTETVHYKPDAGAYFEKDDAISVNSNINLSTGSFSAKKYSVGEDALFVATSSVPFAQKRQCVARIHGENVKQGLEALLEAAVSSSAARKKIQRSPTAKDQHSMRMWKLFNATFPQDHDSFLAAGKKDADVAAFLKASGLNASSVQEVAGTDGHVHLSLPGRWKEASNSKGEPLLRYVFHATKDHSHVPAVLRAGLGSGIERSQQGTSKNGQVNGSDYATGGADTVQFRVSVESSADSKLYIGSVAGGIRFIYAPDIVDRLDPILHSDDYYGCMNPEGSHGSDYAARMPMPAKIRQFNKHAYGSAEMVFTKGVHAKKILRIACDTSSQRDEVVSECRTAGIVEHNNVPIEDFVVVETMQGPVYTKYVKPAGY